MDLEFAKEVLRIFVLLFIAGFLAGGILILVAGSNWGSDIDRRLYKARAARVNKERRKFFEKMDGNGR